MTDGVAMASARAACSSPALRVTEERSRGGTVRLRLAGELDVATGDHLRAAARGGGVARCACFEIDLRAVTFVDCAGMRAVAEVVRSIEDVGGCVVVTAGEAVQRVARLTGTAREVVFA